MSSFNKRTALLTALMLVALNLLGSCGSASGDSENTTAAGNNDSQTDAETEYSYPYPSVNYNGEEFNILNTSDMWTMHCIIGREEATGDALDDAIFSRNTKIEEKFGITIKETLTDNDYLYGTLLGVARNSILSGDDEYDVMYLPLHLVSGMISEGSFNNLLDINSIQLDKDWWYSSFNDVMTINGALYGAVGGSNLMVQDAVRVLAFNEDMMENLGLDKPYDLVRSGAWTLDALNKYISAGASLNGDDTAAWDKNGNTIYGLTNHGNGMLYYMVGCGESNIENVNGVLTNTCGSARWFDVIDRLSTLLTIDDAKFINAHNGNDRDPELGGYIYIFMNQRTLFGVAEVNKFQDFRALDFDYGVVPFPKYDESQDRYYTNVYEGACGAFIPITSSDPEKVGQIVDAMSYEGQMSVVPVFRGIAVESKGLRNEDSVEMLGIIMDTIVPRLGLIFAVDSTLQDALNLAIINKSDTAASLYASNKDSINTKLKDIMENWNS